MLSERTGSRKVGGIEDHREQLLRVVENEPFTIRAGSFIAAVAAGVLWNDLPHWKILSWWAVVATWGLARLVYADHLKKQVCRLASPMNALRWWTISAFITGCLWALAPLIHPDLHSGHGSLLLVVIAGTAAGAALRGAVFAPQPIAFVSPVLLISAAKLIHTGELATNAAAISIIFYLWFLIRAMQGQEKMYSEAHFLKNEAIRNYESVRLYETAMENAPLGMFIATPEAHIVKANAAMCSMLGCSAEEICAERGLAKFVHADDVASVKATYERLLAGESDKERVEARYVRANGKPFWTYSERTLLRDVETGAPKFVLGQVQDIEARKQTDRELKRIIRQKDVAVEAAGLGEFVFRFEGGQTVEEWSDVKAVWSKKLFEIFGVTPESFDCSVGSLFAVIHADDRERVANEIAEDSVGSADRFSVSYRILRPSGEVRHLRMDVARYHDEEDDCMARVGVVADVTEEVAFTRKLEDTVERTKLAAELANLGEARFDVGSGDVELDDESCRIFGLDQETVEDFSARRWARLIHPDDRDRIVSYATGELAKKRLAAEQRQPEKPVSYRIVRPDGGVRHVRTNSQYSCGNDGRVDSVIVAVLDVTEEVRLAEELEKERRELAKALEHSELAASIAGLGISRYDRSTRSMVWDDALIAIYGVEPEFRYSAEAWWALIHPEDREAVRDEMQRAKEERSKHLRLEHRIVRLNGDVRYVKAVLSMAFDAAGEMLTTTAAVLDVTEYVELTENLEAERSKLAAALDRSEVAARAAGLGITSYSASDDFSDWDDRTIEIYGVDGERSLFSLEEWMALIHPEDRERVLNEAYRVREDRERFSSIKHRIIRPDGAVRHLTATWAQEFGPSGEWLSTVTAIMDVTEQVELHQALEAQKIKLQQSLEKKRLAINVAGLGEYWRDFSTGCAHWSERLYEIFGVSPDTFDCSKEAILNALHPGDRKRYEESFSREMSAFRDDPMRQEAFGEIAFRILRPSGEIRYVTSYAYLHRVGDSADAIVLVGLVRDRTDEVLARNSLEKDKADLSTALMRASLAADVAGIGVYELDMKEYEAVWDNRFCEILGVDPEMGIPSSQSWLSYIHPDDRQRVTDELRLGSGEHRSVETEYRIVRPTGEIRHLKAASAAICNDSGEMVKMLVVARDVTEKVLLFEEIESERRLLEATLTAIGDAVIRIDPKGRLEYANRTALEMSGKTEGEAIGDKFTSLFHLNGLSAGALATLGGGKAGASMRNAPAQLLKSSEDAREVELSVEPLVGVGGGATGQVIVLHDVTSLRRSEAELAKSHRLFNVALNHAPIGLSVIDGEGCFSFVNKAMEELCGRSAEMMIGESAATLLSLRDAAQSNVVEFRTASTSDDDAVFEEILRCPSGKELQARICVHRVRNGDGKTICSVVQLQDITAEIRRVTELHEAKELAQVTISSASEGIIRTDENGVITLCNPVAAGFIDADASDLIGRGFAKLYKFTIGARETKIDDPVAVALKRGEPIRMNSTLKLAGKNGVAHRVNLSIAPMIGGDRKVIGAVVLIQDASEIALLTDRLTQQAYTDELTGLGNRRAFEEQLDDCVRAAARRRGRDFLLIIDLDHFKIVNDVCGHGVGDELLGDISQILLSNVRENDFVARIGGDEFGVIMYGADEKSAVRAAEKIIKAVGAYRLNHNNETFQVGASIGLTPVCEGADTSTLMIEADTACYTAKSMGRGRYYVFHANDAAIAETRKSQNWFNRILHGMEEGQFRLFLQQIVSKEKKPVGFEALLRFSEGGKTFGPGAFMDTARRHNMLPKFDRFMFESVVKLLDGEAGESSALKGKYISVNLSASSVADPVFRDWIEKMLDKYAHLTGRLWLELTESDRMRWTDEETAFLRAVRARGVRLYFDDFGTGYNSFDVLKRVEVDGLKLDHSVIRNIIASPIDQALVLASLSITQNLNLEIVAEGVEDRNTFDFLAGIGVKKFQGYLFHKPEEAAKLIKPGKAVRKKAG